ncbi:MAG: glycoside hydrolase family 127 protein [Fimbriimonadaceae bacterium]|nr:glycoside hydrolase family 127 protein [Fimbriimonadaceae bacterium]
MSQPAGYVINSTRSPAARLRSVPLEAVRWTGGYWQERLAQAAGPTLRSLWERLADPAAGHVLANFEIAAHRRQGEPRGTWWQDEWLYKWIEAASGVLRLTGDAWLGERIDRGIELIGAAQADDGYLWTYLAKPGMTRFQYIRHHEVYVMGHLLTAAVAHRRMTGSDALLRLAQRTADFLCRTLGHSVPPCFAHNPSAIMGLVELYREVGEQRYLECARLIVDSRGQTPAQRGPDLWQRPPGIEGTDQIQDRVPLRDEQEVVGHNVFFTYLFAGAADLLLETGDATLKAALDRLWLDLSSRKMSVNGGVSPVGRGLSLRHDKVVEAVGAAYHLPHDEAYNETCGQVGMLLWNQRLLLHEPRAEYAEQAEWLLYNGILPGIGLDGCTFWYRNPLRRHAPGSKDRGLNDLPARELPGEARICCPTNVLRATVQWQSYAWTVDPEGCWLHQYGESLARLVLPGGAVVEVEQQTSYPWSGDLRLVVRQTPDRPWRWRLRTPSWASGATWQLNGQPLTPDPRPGTYASLERTWLPGDEITLHLPMAVRLLEAHPRVEQCRNQLAVARGPILYCLESADLPAGVAVADVHLPQPLDLQPVPLEGLPFGLLALAGHLLWRPAADWSGQLYRDATGGPFTTLPTRLIPYQAWANRGPAAMSIWLPVAWGVGPDGRPT